MSMKNKSIASKSLSRFIKLSLAKRLIALTILLLTWYSIFISRPNSLYLSKSLLTLKAKIGGICNRLGYGGMAESYFSQARKLIVEKNLDTLPKSNEGSLTNSDWLLVSSIYLYQKGRHFLFHFKLQFALYSFSQGEIESIDELKKYQESLLELYHTKKNYSFEVVTSLARFTSLLASLFHHECRVWFIH